MKLENERIAETLRAVLRRMRWDEQGGYPGRKDGKWLFEAVQLTLKPEELDVLFEAAGVVPDEIQSLGKCSDCANAVNGRERGYEQPCASCNRPMMSAFVPVKKAVRRR